MLILTRRVGETIRIGDTVRLSVLDVKGVQVRLGIDAPEKVSIWRAELYERIKQEADAPGVSVKSP